VATTTPRIGLTKPDGTDLVDIAVLNTNFDKIDSNIASTKIQSTKPTTANAGDLWWDSDTGTLYLYYTDGNSSQWVAATSDPINIGVVASQAERDAQYPTPAQGMSVYRTDLGVTQRYYGLFNSSTNPGGRDTAGWYNTEKSQGLVPIQPTTVTIATGTGSTNALGKITFSGAQTLIIDGIFSNQYTNYKLVLSGGSVSATSRIAFRFVKNGVQESGATAYKYAGLASFSSGSTSAHTSNGTNFINLGQHQTVAGAFSLSYDMFDPVNGLRLSMSGKSTVWNSAFAEYSLSGWLDSGVANAWTGISLIAVDATFSGKVQIFGYND
jgi:hypothetical protein